MAKRRAKGNPVAKHVRIHVWEMQTPAWESLCTDARALLIEFRALWNEENRVFLSIRQMMDRLNIGQRRAEKARDELLDRGWIRIMEKGSFTRKVRHASVYALTHEPVQAGQPAPKDFMQFSTVANSATDGSQDSYRGRKVTPKKPQVGSRHGYREPDFPPPHGSQDSYTGSLPVSQGCAGEGKSASGCSHDFIDRVGEIEAGA